MSTIALNAHYDGHHIQLDEPYELPQDAKLLVMVLPPGSIDADRADWLEASALGLNAAYGENEPDYTSADFIQ